MEGYDLVAHEEGEIWVDLGRYGGRCDLVAHEEGEHAPALRAECSRPARLLERAHVDHDEGRRVEGHLRVRARVRVRVKVRVRVRGRVRVRVSVRVRVRVRDT